MKNRLSGLADSKDWLTYYSAYKEMYCEIMRARWAIGDPSFANQLHDIATPDASGSSASIRWAAYSQPSAETLLAFLPLFSDLLRREPHRVRTNRYIFFIPQPRELDFSEMEVELAEIARDLDFWSCSLDTALSWSLSSAPLQSLNAIFAREKPLVTLDDANALADSGDKPTALASLRSRVIQSFAAESSVVPPALRRIYLESSFVLTAVRFECSAESVASLCGEHAGLAACIAMERAVSSGWSAPMIDRCAVVVSISPVPADVYTVKPGDILTRLVRQFYEQSFESLWPLLRVLNPSIDDPNMIRVGQKLNFPKLPRSIES